MAGGVQLTASAPAAMVARMASSVGPPVAMIGKSGYSRRRASTTWGVRAPAATFTMEAPAAIWRCTTSSAAQAVTHTGTATFSTSAEMDSTGMDVFTTTAATPETPWMSRELAIGDATVRIAVASGLENTSKLLDALESGEAAFDFVEIMACPGGCVGGGGQPIRFNSELAQTRAGVLNRLDAADKLRYSHENPDIAQLYADWIGEPLSHTAHEWLHTDQESWKI